MYRLRRRDYTLSCRFKRGVIRYFVKLLLLSQIIFYFTINGEKGHILSSLLGYWKGFWPKIYSLHRWTPNGAAVFVELPTLGRGWRNLWHLKWRRRVLMLHRYLPRNSLPRTPLVVFRNSSFSFTGSNTNLQELYQFALLLILPMTLVL